MLKMDTFSETGQSTDNKIQTNLILCVRKTSKEV